MPLHNLSSHNQYCRQRRPRVALLPLGLILQLPSKGVMILILMLLQFCQFLFQKNWIVCRTSTFLDVQLKAVSRKIRMGINIGISGLDNEKIIVAA